MFTKKEIIITMVFVLFFAILIYLLPVIEENVFRRKKYDYEVEEKLKKEVDKYICTFSSNSNLLKTVIEATFYINNDSVTRIYTRKSETYNNKENYDNALLSVEKNIETENLEIKTTLDDLNYTIITTKGQNILNGTKYEYPTTYNELSEYLKKSNYTCTIRYKKQ